MTNRKRSQFTHFTTQGHWWVPASDHRIAGDLSYKEKDISLSLFGGLSKATEISIFNARPAVRDFSVIHGESLSGTPISLVSSFYTHWHSDFPSSADMQRREVSLRSSRLHCSAMLEGIHLTSEDDTFATCRIEIPHFEAWMDVAPFEVDMDDPFRSIRLDFSMPENQAFDLVDKNCCVRFTHSVKPPRFPLGSSPAIKYRSCLELEPHSPRSFQWLMEFSSEIVNMLSFFYGGPLVSKRVFLYKDRNDHEPISLFYPRHSVKVRKYHPMDFVVRYNKMIQAAFPHILCGWLNAEEDVARARRMLISSERRPAQFIELRFLPLAHALEVLSNESGYSKIVDAATFTDARERMLKSLPESSPNELIDSIKNCLGWANGRNLRGRLTRMLGNLQEETRRLFSVNDTLFISGIVNTRNHYTHYSTKAGRKILQGVELHWAIQKLTLLIRILSLIRAGIPEQDLQVMFRSHHRLSQERSVWQDVSEEGSEYTPTGPT